MTWAVWKRPVVQLGVEDVERVKREAARRRERWRRVTPDEQSGTVMEDRLLADVQGMMGELAVARYLGLPEEPVFEWLGGHGDGGVDLWTADWVSVQVKATVEGRMLLLGRQGTPLRADVYVLAYVGEDGRVVLQGAVTRARAEAVHQVREFRKGNPCMYVRPDMLDAVDQVVRR